MRTPWRRDRVALREYLLGPESPPSIERWKVALDALMLDTDDDRAAGEIGIDESVLDEVDESGRPMELDDAMLACDLGLSDR